MWSDLYLTGKIFPEWKLKKKKKANVMMRFKYISVKSSFNYCLRDESIYIWHEGTLLCITTIWLCRQISQNSIYILMNDVYIWGFGAKKQVSSGSCDWWGEGAIKNSSCGDVMGAGPTTAEQVRRLHHRGCGKDKRKVFFLKPPLTGRWGLTQALADGHAVLLWVKVVAVAGAAAVDEAHALPLAHIKVPAGHGRAAGTRLSLQGAHLWKRRACCVSQLGEVLSSEGSC